MSSNQPEDADNTKREQRRRQGRLYGAIFAAFMGLISFLSVAGKPRFETFHRIDVARLMTAGAGIGVAFVLLIWFFNSPGPSSRT